MPDFEYKVVAAPRRAKSFKGVRSHEDQFACVLAEVMNELARDAWEYLRAESLPVEEKTGITARVESYQSVLVFRRPVVCDQNFFEVPADHLIEFQDTEEDATEDDVIVAPGNRPARVSEVDDFEESSNEAAVLSMLRNRKVRDQLDGDEYPAHLGMAGE